MIHQRDGLQTFQQHSLAVAFEEIDQQANGNGGGSVIEPREPATNGDQPVYGNAESKNADRK